MLRDNIRLRKGRARKEGKGDKNNKKKIGDGMLVYTNMFY